MGIPEYSDPSVIGVIVAGWRDFCGGLNTCKDLVLIAGMFKMPLNDGGHFPEVRGVLQAGTYIEHQTPANHKLWCRSRTSEVSGSILVSFRQLGFDLPNHLVSVRHLFLAFGKSISIVRVSDDSILIGGLLAARFRLSELRTA
jgi:hypothetical protein